MSEMSGTVAVYRLYDRNGVLLYVGQTQNVLSRLRQHSHKPWWSDVYELRTTPYPDRASALEAEDEGIYYLAPLYNVAGTNEMNRRQSAAQKLRHSRTRTAKRIASWSLVYFDDDEAVA